MKTQFKISGVDETEVSIAVSVNSSKYVLTRDEVKRLKEKLRNEMHDVLRRQGYDVSQIKSVK